MLDRELGDLSISNISTDNRRGGMIAARRFLELGIRDVAVFISEPPSRQLQSRIQGFCEIAELANIRPAWIDCHILPDDDRIILGRRAMDEFLKDNPAPAGSSQFPTQAHWVCLPLLKPIKSRLEMR